MMLVGTAGLHHEILQRPPAVMQLLFSTIATMQNCQGYQSLQTFNTVQSSLRSILHSCSNSETIRARVPRHNNNDGQVPHTTAPSYKAYRASKLTMSSSLSREGQLETRLSTSQVKFLDFHVWIIPQMFSPDPPFSCNAAQCVKRVIMAKLPLFNSKILRVFPRDFQSQTIG